MTQRKSFLLHLANQLGRQEIRKPPERKQIGAPEHWKSLILSKSERIDRFCREAQSLGATVDLFQTEQQLQEGLESLLTSFQPKSILIWERKEFRRWRIDSVLKRWEQWMVNPVANRNEALQADVGITTVDYAIADTGTLVLCSDQGKNRGVSLFPTHHIAIVDANQIVTRMGEVLAEFQRGKSSKIPSSIHFISGPSRSSDIENDLSIGVHGPAALHILLKID